MPTKKTYTSKDLYRDYGPLTFAKVLSGFRLSDEMSQVKFAKKIGISPANLCDLEKGRKIPSPLRAARIATKLGLSKAFLIQVAIQDLLRKQKLRYKVTVTS